MKRVKFISVTVAILLIISSLSAGCSNAKTTSGSNNLKGSKIATFGRLGSWPKPPLYQGNYFSSGGVGWPVQAAVFEGLYEFIRVSNRLYPRLATALPENKGNESIIHLRKGVKWNDGKPFTSKDIWAFYILNNGTFITRFLNSIEIPDDYTVIFKWADPQPNEEIKNMLIAQDTQGTIPYHIFSKYVDKANEILSRLPTTNDLDKRGPFTKLIDDKASAELNENWNAFIKYKLKYPIGTGPFMVKTVTSAQLIMEKNPYYYNKDKVKFDRIKLYQTDQAGGLALIQSGKIAQTDYSPTKDIMETILRKNKDMVFYKMKDEADLGVIFNIKMKPFDDVNFRRAVQYIADRKKIRDAANWAATVGDISVIGMPLNLMNWINDDVRKKMTKFIYDPDKAAALLQQDGWQKGSDGIWRDKNGKIYNLSIGAPSSFGMAVNASEILAEQFTAFGLPTKLSAVDDSIYYTNARRPNNKYHMSTDWIDVTWNFLHPWFALSEFWRGAQASYANFPIVTKKGKDYGKLDMKLPGPDGKIIDINETIDKLLYMNDEDMRKAVSALAWIANENAFGLDYFLNSSSIFINKAIIDENTLPMHNLFSKYNRDMPLPTNPVDEEAVYELNYGFDGGMLLLVNGTWKPGEKAYNDK
ncbi:ABC transporter substrate-binding protein [Caldanaerobius fijiensis]|uniref:ABC transporter substrate-binding protein n=1 Tax=Caldanaerobius fijiensis TaxID=456330 RepID=UPI0009353013|nr:ABC transporter substrate-binding protein [Caldanaerobius fijiensis]